MSARVTVIIPTHDRARWLAESMRSVLASELADLTLLVADNASTDATPAIASSIAEGDHRVVYVRRPHDIGMVANFNDALDRVETEYCWILSDDDVLAPGALRATVTVLDRHPSAGVAHGRFDTVGAEGEVLGRDLDGMRDLRADTLETGRAYLRKAMRWGPRVMSPAALMRTDALEGLRYDPEEYPAFDLGLWLRMALRWDFAFVATTVIRYRVHDASGSVEYGSVSGSGYAFGPAMFDKMDEVKGRFLDEHGAGLDDLDELLAIRAAGTREELLARAKHATLPDRRFGDTVRALSGVIRDDRRLLLDPAAWLMLGGSIAGPSNRARLNRLLHH